MLKVLILSVALIALALAGIAVKMFFLKGGQFTKSCSSVDTGTGEKIGCVCENTDQRSCVNYARHHGEEQAG